MLSLLFKILLFPLKVMLAAIGALVKVTFPGVFVGIRYCAFAF
jgi:hypothetical protein